LSLVADMNRCPKANVLGWQTFSSLINSVALPVYSFGGMRLNDLPQALASGAQGIAM